LTSLLSVTAHGGLKVVGSDFCCVLELL
jgi:hypothetical protein